MTSYYAGAAARAHAREQSEPQVLRDHRCLAELRAAVEPVEARQ